jgi:hypothetical protein
MIELGIILLVLGAIGAIVCHFAHVPVGVRIGFITAVVGLGLIIAGFVVAELRGVDVDAARTALLW